MNRKNLRRQHNGGRRGILDYRQAVATMNLGIVVYPLGPARGKRQRMKFRKWPVVLLGALMALGVFFLFKAALFTKLAAAAVAGGLTSGLTLMAASLRAKKYGGHGCWARRRLCALSACCPGALDRGASVWYKFCHRLLYGQSED